MEAVAGSLADLLAAEAVAPGSVVPLGNRSEQGAPWGLYPVCRRGAVGGDHLP